MTVLTLAGKKIDWANPPKATAKVLWSQRTTSGKQVIGSLRTIAHLDWLNLLAKKKFGRGIVVLQGPFNTGVSASAGTHDYDACLDVWIPGVDGFVQQRFFRANGGGAYYRRPPLFGTHIHYFTLPPQEGKDRTDDYRSAGFKVGKYVDGGWSLYGRPVASAQISDYYNHRTALSGHAHDPSWFPPDIRATIFSLSDYIKRQRFEMPSRPPVAPPKPPVKPPVSRNPVDGVDISHYQNGVLGMAAAKTAGVRWVCHKVTEGLTWRDSNYSRRRAEAKKAGLRFGGYHFARPRKGKGDATRQAKFFLSVTKPVPGDLRPMLDIEDAGDLTMAQVAAWVAEFSRVVEKAVGVRPILYTQSSWNLGPANETKHIIWRARYNNDNRPPERPFDIHQFSNGDLGRPNSVAGFGHVDLNKMRKGLSMKAMLIPQPTPTPKPGPEPQTPPPVPPKPPKAVKRLRFAWASLQFSDHDDQHTHDIETLFGRDYDFLFGSEAGPGSGNTNAELIRVGKAKGYRVYNPKRYDGWIAVRASLVKRLSWKVGAIFALNRSSKTIPRPPGRWGDKGVVWARFILTEGFGAFTLAAVHFLTFGGAGAYKTEADEEYRLAIMEWLVQNEDAEPVLGGDFNLSFSRRDVMKELPMLPCWDERDVHKNTGHGDIDGICRRKDSKRMKCVGARVLDDEALFMYGDHYVVEAEYDITAV